MDMKEINSVNNSIIKQIRKLKQKKYRKDQMSYLIEGFHLVKEALDMEQKYEYVIGTQETINKLKLTNKIFDKSIILVNQAICDQLSDTENSQDIFMVLQINQPHSFSFKFGKWVILDNLTDPGNVGTIIRTADAASFDGVILSNQSVDLYNSKVQRSMQGSQFHLQIVQTDIEQVLLDFKNNGLPLYASVLDKDAEILYNCKAVSQLGLIIGNEAHGVSRQVQLECDHKIYIPIKGKAESLNAAVAAGIMIYYFS